MLSVNRNGKNRAKIDACGGWASVKRGKLPVPIFCLLKKRSNLWVICTALIRAKKLIAGFSCGMRVDRTFFELR
jgi:hypothetical protein